MADTSLSFYAVLLGAGYLAGSIPFGLVLSYIFGYGDIRAIGSGNIGATNVLRTGNKLLAFATLILDSGKGAFTLLALRFLFDIDTTLLLMICGLGAIVGHCFPVWLGFKGGKGVATTLGTLLAAAPLVGLIACGTWLVSALTFRISSLSALIAIALMPLTAVFFYGVDAASIGLLIVALVFWRHKDNIRRIHNGTEPRVGQKKKNAKPVSN